jgi:hypothetical protein
MSAAKDFINGLDIAKLDEKTQKLVRDLVKSEEYKHIAVSDDMFEFEKTKAIVQAEFPDAVKGYVPPTKEELKKQTPSTKVKSTVATVTDEEVEVESDTTELQKKVDNLEERLELVKEMSSEDKKNESLKERVELVKEMLLEAKEQLTEAKKTKKKVSKKELGGIYFKESIEPISDRLIEVRVPNSEKIVYIGKQKHDALQHINLSWQESLPLLLVAYNICPEYGTLEFLKMAKAADMLYEYAANINDNYFELNIIKSVIRASSNSEADVDVLFRVAALADKYNEAVDDESVLNMELQAKPFLFSKSQTEQTISSPVESGLTFEELLDGIALSKEDADKHGLTKDDLKYATGGVVGSKVFGKVGSDFKANVWEKPAIDNDPKKPDVTIYKDTENELKEYVEGLFDDGFQDAELFEKRKGKYHNFSSWSNLNEKQVAEQGGELEGSWIGKSVKLKTNSGGYNHYVVNKYNKGIYNLKGLNGIDDLFANTKELETRFEGDVMADGGSVVRANNSKLLKYANFEDDWHINLLKLNPNRNQDGLKYKNKKEYSVVRINNKGSQEVFEFETLEKAESKFTELVNLSKNYSNLIKEGTTNNYAKGGSVVLVDTELEEWVSLDKKSPKITSKQKEWYESTLDKLMDKYDLSDEEGSLGADLAAILKKQKSDAKKNTFKSKK